MASESAAEAQNRIEGCASDEEEANSEGNRLPRGKQENWKIVNAAKKSRVRYKTLDEVIQENNGGVNVGSGAQQKAMHGVKIIDMTGPEQRVYDDFSAFSRRAKAPTFENGERTRFDVPELMHNLNSLVDLTEEEIRRNDREIRFLKVEINKSCAKEKLKSSEFKDQTEVLKESRKRLSEQVVNERDELRRMQEVAEIIEQFQVCASSGANQSPTLDDIRALFLRLRKDYAVEYKLYELDSAAISSVLPLIKAHFARWEPLEPEQVEHGLDLLREWREILVDSVGSSTRGGGAPMFDYIKKDQSK